jgi:excisionase family DNA binding protein
MPNDGPQWYTIKDAAAYLDVGEPTIYRWMRDGRITFRKIGDSTRFLQQDLDALVQVHPSERDVDAVRQICPSCHFDELIQGRVQGTGRVYFTPENTSFWSFRTNNVETRASMCPRCGVITWFGDTEELERLPQGKGESA